MLGRAPVSGEWEECLVIIVAGLEAADGPWSFETRSGSPPPPEDRTSSESKQKADESCDE